MHRRMRKPCKGRCTVIPFLFALILITCGLVLIINQTLSKFVLHKIRKETSLVKGKTGYHFWTMPLKSFVNVYLFHVNNPDGVLQGDSPQFIERGPYVYDCVTEKQILKTDEVNDEVEFNVKKKFSFNARRSANLSENDKINILNAPYIAALNMLAEMSESLFDKFAPYMAKLFPVDNPTFFRDVQVKSIVFDGIFFTCDDKKDPQMKMICGVLKGKKPPIISNTDQPNTYKFSFLGATNDTLQGPLTVNRGWVDFRRVGDITSVKSKRKLKYWNTPECNTITGSDGITWPMLHERLPRIYTYLIESCRFLFLEYIRDEVVNGIVGWRYEITDKIWSPEENNCFCPMNLSKMMCPPTGILNIQKCVQAPVFSSQPHFFQGDPKLLTYAGGLKPEKVLHSTFVVIEPLTGIPLNGSRRLQINVELKPLQENFLENVSRGFFPLIWWGENGYLEDEVVENIYHAHRMQNLGWHVQWLPILIGIVILLTIPLCCEFPKTKQRVTFRVADSVLLHPNTHGRFMFYKRRTIP